MLVTTRQDRFTIQQGDDAVTLDPTEALTLFYRIAAELPNGVEVPEMTRDLDAGTLTCPHDGTVFEDQADAVYEIDASIRSNRGDWDVAQDSVFVTAEDSNFETVTYIAACCRRVVRVPAEVSVVFD